MLLAIRISAKAATRNAMMRVLQHAMQDTSMCVHDSRALSRLDAFTGVTGLEFARSLSISDNG
jgi:hypothetical protein